MGRFIRVVIAAALAASIPGASAGAGAAAPHTVERAAVRDSSAVFDANELCLRVSNLGSFAWPEDRSPGGLEWPRGSGRHVVYAAGLWVAGLVGADTLVTVAEYTSEFAAGPLDASGAPVDPGEADPAHRVYSTRRCDEAVGLPRIGDQTLWSVYNDAVAPRHTNWMAGTEPLGVEVRQTVYGFGRGGNLDRVAFLEFDIRNRGAKHVEGAYVGLWLDADLGGAQDDLVGCDPALDLGFTYNGADSDWVYGAHSPAVGCALLQGPIAGGDTLRMTSFGRLLKNWNEPADAGMAYRRLARGLPDADLPAPFPCDEPGTRFEVSGDPVAGTGCRDTLPADRRMLLGCGPFTLAPGDSARVVALLAIGGRDEEGDRLSNLGLLRATVAEARAQYRTGFAGVPAVPPCDAPLRLLMARPNPAQAVQRIEFVVPVGMTCLTVRVHDAAGRRVWERPLTGLRPGVRSFEWDGRGDDGRALPAGIYFVRLDGAAGEGRGRVVRLR
jgi:hypothetical protein